MARRAPSCGAHPVHHAHSQRKEAGGRPLPTKPRAGSVDRYKPVDVEGLGARGAGGVVLECGLRAVRVCSSGGAELCSHRNRASQRTSVLVALSSPLGFVHNRELKSTLTDKMSLNQPGPLICSGEDRVEWAGAGKGGRAQSTCCICLKVRRPPAAPHPDQALHGKTCGTCRAVQSTHTAARQPHHAPTPDAPRLPGTVEVTSPNHESWTRLDRDECSM
jgi:hypothetical protein